MLFAIPVWLAIGSVIIRARYFGFLPKNWPKLGLTRRAWFPKKCLHITCVVFHLRLCRLARLTKTMTPHGPVPSVCREESFSSWRHRIHQSYLWGARKLRRRG